MTGIGDRPSAAGSLWNSEHASPTGAEPAAGLGRMVWGVAALLHAVSDSLGARFAACTVRGEISGFTRSASGHCYFSLKDADGASALVRCAMFRRAAALLAFVPRDGQVVEVRGRVSLYEPRGELNFVVEALLATGAGALYEQFVQLRARLASEGLFDPERKRSLPVFPRRVGLITSLAGAAAHDVLSALARRAPHVEVLLYPSVVQGVEAPAALVDALRTANARAEVEVLIVCRGGGSLEDLWTFNDERVVRAIAGTAVPVICGVGHETDVTLADLAADLRAPTPTAAAELVALPTDDWHARLRTLQVRLAQHLMRRLDGQGHRLDMAALRLLRPQDVLRRQARTLALLAQRWASLPSRRMANEGLRIERLEQRLVHATERSLRAARHREEQLGMRLRGLDPQRVLARGFAWLQADDGRAVLSVRTLTIGQTVEAVLVDGRVRARIAALVDPAGKTPLA